MYICSSQGEGQGKGQGQGKGILLYRIKVRFLFGLYTYFFITAKLLFKIRLKCRSSYIIRLLAGNITKFGLFFIGFHDFKCDVTLLDHT